MNHHLQKGGGGSPPGEGRRVGQAVDLAEAFTMKPYVQRASEYAAPGYGLGIESRFPSQMQQPMLDRVVILLCASLQ